MRLLTYNILKGGEDRMPQLTAVMRDVDADVIALQECNGFDDDGRLQQLAGALEMHPVLGASASGYHVALLCRPSLFECALPPGEGLSRASAGALLRHGTHRMAVVSLHLSPYDPAERTRELTRILGDVVGGHRPAVLLGDFNAISPVDAPALDAGAWPERYRDRHVRGGRIDTTALGMLGDAGFVDACLRVPEAAQATRPTLLYRHRDVPRQRLDFIFCSGDLEGHIRVARVIDDETTQLSSDHLPVVAELSLDDSV